MMIALMWILFVLCIPPYSLHCCLEESSSGSKAKSNNTTTHGITVSQPYHLLSPTQQQPLATPTIPLSKSPIEYHRQYIDNYLSSSNHHNKQSSTNPNSLPTTQLFSSLQFLILSREWKEVLSRYYSRSPTLTLETLYPEYDWQFGQFASSSSYFDDSSAPNTTTIPGDDTPTSPSELPLPNEIINRNPTPTVLIASHKRYLDQVAKKLNIRVLEDWYRVEITYHPSLCRFLNCYYNGYLYEALKLYYPEKNEEWKPWLFSKVPQSYWKDRSNHKKYFDWLAKVLMVRNKKDWGSIRVQDIYNYRGRGLLNNYYNGSLTKALMTVYPEMNINYTRYLPSSEL